MSKSGLSSVDVAALAAELSSLLVGARVDKAYQPAKERILLRSRRKGAGKLDLLYDVGRFITVTRRAPDNPDKPSMVAQILRNTLENARIVGVSQIGFDRLLRMDFERGDGKRSLVFELFGDGNMLLIGPDDKIELPLRGEDFTARRLRKGEPYLPPPGPAAPFGVDEATLRKISEEGKDIIRSLATTSGFGPIWAEELCLRAGLDKKTKPSEMTPEQWTRLVQAIHSLGRDIARNDLAPAVVYEGPTPVDAVPFVMMRYPAPRFSHEEAPTFREALDVYFMGATGDEEEEPDDPRRPRFEEARGKIEHQVRQMEDAIAGFIREEEAHKADGDALYAAFPQAQALLADLNKAREDRSWAAVESVLAEGRIAGNPLALQVPELRPHEGSATLRLKLPQGGERRVVVDLRKSVHDNAEVHYATAKKARSRRDGAENALKDAAGRMRALEAKGLDGFGTAPARTQRASRHFWFETYRWTVTPNGLLAVGGRNASQNDAVVKKYLRDGDRYVHADAHGAPSVVLRPADGPAGEFSAADLRAACHFAAASSRAWRQGGAASAYWVTPAQVSKTPRSGEFVPRGAWIIHGKRNTEDHLDMVWAVGLVRFHPNGVPVPKDEPDPPKVFPKLVGGAASSLEPFANEIVRLVPGDIEPNDAAATLAERFGVSVEDAQGVLPAGNVAFAGS